MRIPFSLENLGCYAERQSAKQQEKISLNNLKDKFYSKLDFAGKIKWLKEMPTRN